MQSQLYPWHLLHLSGAPVNRNILKGGMGEGEGQGETGIFIALLLCDGPADSLHTLFNLVLIVIALTKLLAIYR